MWLPALFVETCAAGRMLLWAWRASDDLSLSVFRIEMCFHLLVLARLPIGSLALGFRIGLDQLELAEGNSASFQLSSENNRLPPLPSSPVAQCSRAAPK